MGVQLGLSALVVFASLLIWGGYWARGMILSVPLTVPAENCPGGKD